MSQDFAVLYEELDLDPGCSLDELRHAYRRRIGELHPDRNGGEPADDDGKAMLGELTALYANAVRFQRQYGRLPGSVAAPPAATLSPSNERSYRALVVPPRRADPAARRRRTTTLAVLMVLLLLLWMVVVE